MGLLARDLRRLGVKPGAVLMVHASLRAIGPVENGAAGVVAALDETAGPEGSLLMVLGADESHPFDAATTPAQPDVGALAEVFRRTPGTRVSDHPEGRFAARGRLADLFTANVPWHDYYGPGSPLERFVEAGGYVLRLGADTNTVTLLHLAEYLCSVPNKRRVRRTPAVMGASGPRTVTVECLDDSNGIVDRPGEDYFSTILNAYLASHSVPSGRVGNALSELIPGRDLLAFGVEWMNRNLI